MSEKDDATFIGAVSLESGVTLWITADAETKTVQIRMGFHVVRLGPADPPGIPNNLGLRILAVNLGEAQALAAVLSQIVSRAKEWKNK